jgi:putative acetyltransferase
VVQIREFQPDDAPTLLAQFRDTVRRINARDYSAEQIGAWASDEIDVEGWAARFGGRFVKVAEEEARIVGFGELEEGGRIDRFYVAADSQGRGVGRALLGAIVDEARRRGMEGLVVEASITARPFFERQGFGVVAPQVVRLRGVEFRNFRMSRRLG